MMRFNPRSILLGLIIIFGGMSLVVSAQEFSSINYTVSNPVIFPGGYSTSTNFGLSGVVSQMAIGTSTANAFKLFGGFLYFPFISTPILGATPGDTAVALSWTAADSALGWVVGSYSVGQSTVSGGSYTFTNVGNVLSSNRTGLTNGTAYFFVVKVADALGNFIATSTEVSATPVAAAVPPASGGGGGGGGGTAPPTSVSGGVTMNGRAYPSSTITILKDGQVVSSVQADANANFQTSITNLNAGSFIFSVYSEDSRGSRSGLLTFPITIASGVFISIGGIFIAPTVAVDKSQVKRGDDIAIFGQTVAKSDVTIQINSEQQFFAKVKSDSAGAYLYNFDTAPLEYGDHSTKSKSSTAGEISSYGNPAAFIVGTQNIRQGPPKKCSEIGDVNNDCKVNLVDYSILAYWFKRANPPTKVDLNRDGKVNLVDFSIMAYNWTG